MRRLGAAAAIAAALLAGCGDGDETTGPSEDPPAAGGGGALSVALPVLPASLDPLAAVRFDDQLVTRQVHEPLVATLSGPYDDRSRQPGLALALRPSGDRTLWRVQLRSGVRFHDGTPLNAQAVLANGRRWGSLAAGEELLPGLFAVDAPRPDEVRFQFSRPRPDLPELLASPRLGVVSPRALRPRSGESARFRSEAAGTGAGPFRLRARSQATLGIVRNATWWGTPLGLAAALDRVGFSAVAAADERLAQRVAGAVQATRPLDRDAGAVVAADPLLRSSGKDSAEIAHEASVRGLDQGSGVPVLSRVWLTTIAG
jgi:peptide/nickel transport system substrate-binding protein